MLIFSMPIFNKNQNRWDQLLSFCVETEGHERWKPLYALPFRDSLNWIKLDSVVYQHRYVCVCGTMELASVDITTLTNPISAAKVFL